VYSVSFILALLAFGALAAYLGDVLGYRLGKRRLSLLRLRPRTTARLVGVLVGLLIPGVTVAIGALLIPEVRLAVLQIDDLRRELQTLRSERDTMQEQRDLLRNEANRERAAASRARTDADKSRGDLTKVRIDLDTATNRLTVARELVARARDQANRLRQSRDEARTSLREAQTVLREAEEALAAAERDLQTARRSVAEAEQAKNLLEADRDGLKTERDTLEAQAQILRRNVKSLRDQLTAVTEEWESQHTLFALRHPILELETELVRGVVKRPETIDALTDELVALYVVADAAAEAAGAGKGDNGRYVRVTRPVPLTRLSDSEETVSEEAILGYIRKLLWEDEDDEHVVRIIVDRRAFRGEQVGVRFEAPTNKLVFHEGDTLVTRKLGAHLEQVEAFEQLWLLIADPEHSEVRRQARAAGMLPKPKSGGYGDIEIHELYEAAQACAGRPEPVTVKVQAAADAYTVGPLPIKIVVEPSGGGPP